MDIDSKRIEANGGDDCDLGPDRCEACRQNMLEHSIESAQQRAELDAELAEAETQG